MAKRPKLDTSFLAENPRKQLTYDSDELTQRHSPDSSSANSPTYIDLDDDDGDSVPVKLPGDSQLQRLDFSSDSPIIKSLRDLVPKLQKSRQFKMVLESAAESRPGDKERDKGEKAEGMSCDDKEILQEADVNVPTAANPTISPSNEMQNHSQAIDERDSESNHSDSPADQHFADCRDTDFVFGGPIPEGVELGFRTAANVPIEMDSQMVCMNLFEDTQKEETEVVQKVAVDKWTRNSPESIDPFEDSQISDEVLNSVADREYKLLSFFSVIY